MKRAFRIFVLVLWSSSAWAAIGGSPYLDDHAADPVRWRVWGEEALAEAAAAGKPILLSIGFSSCRWCHVMKRESFRDPAVAELINRLTVPVIVDRELSPDVDAFYQQAARGLGFQAGWPLTLFLDANGRPFLGGGYFPPEPRSGVPSFRQILERAAAMHREGIPLSPPPPPRPSPAAGDALARLAAEADPFHGGFGVAPKHPRLPALEAVWRESLRSGRRDYRDIVVLALEAMIAGGIHDHVGGGFFRHVDDHAWREPHFEKMLDLNAAMLSLLLEAWKEDRSPRLEGAVRNLVRFLLDEMRLDNGAFATAFDAESDGVEGGFQRWSVGEIREALDEDADEFLSAFALSDAGVLFRTGEEPAGVSAMLDRLAAARDERPRPLRDDKVLADANGLAVAALAGAGLALGEPGWLAAAEAAYGFVMSNIRDADRLAHWWWDGRSGGGVLDDQGAMALAALALFEATGDPARLEEARRMMTAAEEFRDPLGGGYFHSREAAAPGLPRLPGDLDDAAPSGAAMVIEALARLYHLSGEEIFRERAAAALDRHLPRATADPLRRGGILAAADSLQNGMEITIVGSRDAARPLLDAVFAISAPGRALLVVSPDAEFPEGHPAYMKEQLDGLPTAYVCVASVCSLPVTAPGDLAGVIREMRKGGGL